MTDLDGLRRRIDDLLRGIEGELAAAGLARADLFTGMRQRLHAPVRVALIGRVSSGKSTLANALLGVERAPTGIRELTYHVLWLRYAERTALVAHLTDGRAEPHALRDLESLVARARHDADPAVRDYLASIAYLELQDPNPHLARYDLIDTPGLDSYFGEDSRHTLDFLGMTPDQVRGASVARAGDADAVVALFSRGLARSEEVLLDEFAAAGLDSASPLTALGVLTKIERYWPAHDPLAEGRRVAGRIMTRPLARRLLYDLRPVASLVGAAAGTMTEADIHDLAALRHLDEADLTARLRFGPDFVSQAWPGFPVSRDRRAALFRRFGGYGIHLATRLVRAGAGDHATLRAQLTEASGLGSLRRLLVEHFGDRAAWIKLQRLAFEANTLPARFAGDARERAVFERELGRLTQLLVTEHTFEELAVLRLYYEGRLNLTAEQGEELLRVTGQRGHSAASRLGLPDGAGPRELAGRAAERLRCWSALATRPNDGDSRRAARAVRRSYEILLAAG
ncbi:dynamin family protein [Phytohabitans suffuscus]|uniref:Isoniazid inductible gene protein IniC n=1 Tax=Phytohabitans suffuscus TaxID=624315 RepID=A0A6F8YVH8_9ACTN|nr:dynamin family protein [Phytohabitans suffuscus]BCB90079.1 isoniazid inductible gene protein IniC [Phytohabitans suffuscus]